MATTNRVTLAEFMKRATNPFEKGVVQAYLGVGPYMGKVPIVPNDSLSVKWRRVESLPDGGNRLINEAFEPGVSVTSAAAMSLALYGRYIDIDTEILSEPGGATEQAEQVARQSEGLARQIANDFVNGDEAANPKAFSGIKTLIAGLPARQTIAGNLDLDSAADRKTNAYDLIRLIQTGIQRIQQGTGGKPDLMLVDDDLIPLLGDAFRQITGYWTTTKDGDRVVDTMFGIPVEAAGFNSAQNGIIGANHDGDGKTSIYLLKFGEQFVHLVQKYPLRTSKPMMLDDLVTSRIKLEWAVAPRIKNDFAAVRITGLDITV